MASGDVDTTEAMRTRWTRQQVEDLLRNEELAYQRVELPYGLSSPGEDRSKTAAVIFSDGVEGKTVLDIGCSLGYFCHEAVRRNAARVVGVDTDENRLRQARLIADCLAMPIEFRLLDIEEQNPPGRFDVVLMLNVLHHLHDPVSVLDKVCAHTGERLVLEVAGTRSPQAAKLLKMFGASWWLRRRIERLPLAVVGRDQTVTRKNEQKFFFSPSAMKHLLIDQRGDFAKLDVRPSEFKNRYIAVVWKLQVEHLIVVGGCTAAGKSTICERLMRGELPELAAGIGMDRRRR